MNKKGIFRSIRFFRNRQRNFNERTSAEYKKSMRYLFRQQQDSQEKENFMAASIFSFQKMNLKK